MTDAHDETTTLLHRQVPPSLTQGDEPLFEAFLPSSKDDRKLSTRDGAVMNAMEAFDYHVTALGLHSAGTWSFSRDELEGVAEFEYNGQAIPAVPLIDDAATEGPAHASVDFSVLAERKLRQFVARYLRDCEADRGRLHP